MLKADRFDRMHAQEQQQHVDERESLAFKRSCSTELPMSLLDISCVGFYFYASFLKSAVCVLR